MITRGFIEKVHMTFDELGYREKEQLDFDRFEQAVIRTLTHCKELEDAINVVNMYQFCLKQWRKIEKMFRCRLDVYNEYAYEGNSLISVVSDEDALGTCYITNGITKEIKAVSVASHSFEEKLFAIEFAHDRFAVFEDGQYYIKYAKMSAAKMKLFDRDSGNCLCNIVLSEDSKIFLENNVTPYELVIYDDFIGIYERSYIEGLNDTDMIEPEKLVGDIEWDILDEGSELGLAKLNVYRENADLEILLSFAASTFLVFQQYIQDAEKQYQRTKRRSNLWWLAFMASRR